MSDVLIESRAKILDLKVPFTREELNHAWRTKAHETHPDKGGSSKAFIKTKEAYDFLCVVCPETTNQEQNGTYLKTYEGDFICDLGKGLGDLINSVNCNLCHGDGYVKQIHHIYHTTICPACKGRGNIFVWRRGFPSTDMCFYCFGSGQISSSFFQFEETTLLHTCLKCKGTGQEEILNPVLPKNRTTTPQRRTIPKKKKLYCSCGAVISGSLCWRCKKEYKPIER